MGTFVSDHYCGSIPGGNPMSAAILLISSFIICAALFCAAPTAATIKSSSISVSLGSILLLSMRTLISSSRPLTTALTIPPPASALTCLRASSSCIDFIFSCISRALASMPGRLARFLRLSNIESLHFDDFRAKLIHYRRHHRIVTKLLFQLGGNTNGWCGLCNRRQRGFASRWWARWRNRCIGSGRLDLKSHIHRFFKQIAQLFLNDLFFAV